MTLHSRISIALLGAVAACGTDNTLVAPASLGEAGATLAWRAIGQPPVPQTTINSIGFAGPNAPAGTPSDSIAASSGLSRGEEPTDKSE